MAENRMLTIISGFSPKTSWAKAQRFFVFYLRPKGRS